MLGPRVEITAAQGSQAAAVQALLLVTTSRL